MSDELPSFNNSDEIPGKYTVVEKGEKDATGRRKFKIRIRKKVKTRTRIKKPKTRSFKTRGLKILQIVLLVLAVFSLFYAGFYMITSDRNRPIIIKRKFK